MDILSIIIVVLVTYVLMEGITWLTHRYVMHGFLWVLHKDHHVKEEESKYEKNDLFFFIFAIPSFLLILLGYNEGVPTVTLWIGVGIALYGLSYLFVHDLFIHQRIKVLRNTKNKYFLSMRRAHKMHHKHITKEDGEAFGFLYVPKKYRN